MNSSELLAMLIFIEGICELAESKEVVKKYIIEAEAALKKPAEQKTTSTAD